MTDEALALANRAKSLLQAYGNDNPRLKAIRECIDGLAALAAAHPPETRAPDPRDKIPLHILNKEGFTPYALVRLAEALWKPGSIRDSYYGFADQWKREVAAAQPPYNGVMEGSPTPPSAPQVEPSERKDAACDHSWTDGDPSYCRNCGIRAQGSCQ